MAVSVKGNISNVVYGKGDVCLKLTPFDNYRMFTLYEDWREDDRKPIDLSNGQKLYLVFRSKNKEIRIPEYDLVNEEYTVDKVNGQVIFKISKKNAIDILALTNKVFYITRVFDISDEGNVVRDSDEEVLYTGLWADESTQTVDNYTSQIKNLMNILEDRNKQIRDLQEANAKLMKDNTTLSAAVAELQDSNEKLNSEMTTLTTKLNEYESGNEYDGILIGEGTHHTVITGGVVTGKNGPQSYTEEQLAEALQAYENKYKN